MGGRNSVQDAQCEKDPTVAILEGFVGRSHWRDMKTINPWLAQKNSLIRHNLQMQQYELTRKRPVGLDSSAPAVLEIKSKFEI